MSSSAEDKKLVKKLKKGNVKAFDALYFRYVPKLHTFANSLIKDKEKAEEAVQEIFIKLWERREFLDPKKSIEAYLFQSVKYYIFNLIRDQRPIFKINDIPEHFLTVSYSSQFDNDDDGVLEKSALELIESLPKIQKEVFKYSRLEGLKNKEIAARLNLSIRTVEHHIYLATKFLRSELSKKAVSFLLFFGVFL